MPDIISISQSIQHKIAEIDLIRSEIRKRGDSKAQTIADYDRSLAITIIRLRNGEPMELDGHAVVNPQATVLEKIARGLCWEEKLRMERADAEYKSAVTNLSACEAQLNGEQSILRYQDKV